MGSPPSPNQNYALAETNALPLEPSNDSCLVVHRPASKITLSMEENLSMLMHRHCQEWASMILNTLRFENPPFISFQDLIDVIDTC